MTCGVTEYVEVCPFALWCLGTGDNVSLNFNRSSNDNYIYKSTKHPVMYTKPLDFPGTLLILKELQIP
jgi:hypothetical protein